MTKYKNISTVLPGQVIKVSNDFKIEKFFFDTVKNNIIESENSYEKLNEDDLFQEVQKQIRLNSNSDAEKSLMLSSGIDSLAIKLILENIKSFTLCYEKFRNTNHDEIFKLKNKLDKSVDYPLYIKNYEVENTNDNIENFTDSFSIDGSQYYLITKYIKKHNVKMAITGVGADEMFNSYPSSKFIPLFRKYNRILPNIENKINFKFNSKIERVLRLLFNCKTVSDSYLIFREIYSEKEIKNINLKNFDFFLEKSENFREIFLKFRKFSEMLEKG